MTASAHILVQREIVGIYIYIVLYNTIKGKTMTEIKAGIKSDPNTAIKGSIACTSYLDEHGRLYVPLRSRIQAGLERGVGYNIEIHGVILSNFKKQEVLTKI